MAQPIGMIDELPPDAADWKMKTVLFVCLSILVATLSCMASAGDPGRQNMDRCAAIELARSYRTYGEVREALQKSSDLYPFPAGSDTSNPDSVSGDAARCTADLCGVRWFTYKYGDLVVFVKLDPNLDERLWPVVEIDEEGNGCSAPESKQLAPADGKSPSFCEDRLAIAGLLTSAQTNCGFSKYSTYLVDAASRCMSELGEKRAMEIVEFGMREFIRNSEERGMQAFCGKLLEDFPTLIGK